MHPLRARHSRSGLERRRPCLSRLCPRRPRPSPCGWPPVHRPVFGQHLVERGVKAGGIGRKAGGLRSFGSSWPPDPGVSRGFSSWIFQSVKAVTNVSSLSVSLVTARLSLAERLPFARSCRQFRAPVMSAPLSADSVTPESTDSDPRRQIDGSAKTQAGAAAIVVICDRDLRAQAATGQERAQTLR